jgi:arginine deiminase
MMPNLSKEEKVILDYMFSTDEDSVAADMIADNHVIELSNNMYENLYKIDLVLQSLAKKNVIEKRGGLYNYSISERIKEEYNKYEVAVIGNSYGLYRPMTNEILAINKEGVNLFLKKLKESHIEYSLEIK